MSLFNDASQRKTGFRLALAATCLATAVVMLGAFTRLVDAGLGCPDWPGCYGHLTWPTEAHEITRAQELFPDAPVEASKTWPEMVHRYFASTLGLVIGILAILAWRKREQDGYPFRLPIFLLFVVVWQGLFGMWTVTLKLWPQVVTLHLLGGMATLSLLWLLTLRLDDTRWVVSTKSWRRLQNTKLWLVGAVIIVFTQIALGGWTSANYAAFACPDFPSCHAQWWPPMNASQGFNFAQSIGPNYLGGQLESEARVAIHMGHRIGAIITTLYLLVFCGALLRVNERRVRRMALVIVAALGLQITLGISNILWMVPLSMAVLHNIGAALLLLTLVTLGAKIWAAQAPRQENLANGN